MKNQITSLLKGRFAIYSTLLLQYLTLSFLLRICLFVWSIGDIEFSIIGLTRIWLSGFAYDIFVGLSFFLVYLIYLWLLPKPLIGTILDKILTYACLSFSLFILLFSLVAELPFWDEFGVRFNFIAVDYLIYTYEVVENINQSMPIPIILSALLSFTCLILWLLSHFGKSRECFNSKTGFINRSKFVVPNLLVFTLLIYTLNNKIADFSNNTALNELGKNGTFSFFAAFRSNELDYKQFYPQLDEKKAYNILKEELLQDNQQYTTTQWDNLTRITKGEQEKRPNIIMVSIESFSADFLQAFGNKQNLTPVYDSLAKESVFFTKLYATGTRTVRGMEALTLCVPPTPGNSIVRRPNNDNIFSVATILKAKNYKPYFIYGGDGYFDNMNTYFGGQGFDIVDRDRGNPLSEKIKTKRFNIEDNEVSFENAWGICDEDLYAQSLKYADLNHQLKQPFFQFVMTTSNHKPYTFPTGTIDLPQGHRPGAVKYTDYALGKFIAAAKQKPWFKHTVFIIVADHCASSAGKWEINIDKHHIPAIFYNLGVEPQRIDRLSSQIDVLPTLFGYLGWNYQTAWYGKDINRVKPGEERALIGNYRTLGLLKDSIFTQIDDRKRIIQFKLSPNQGMEELSEANMPLIEQTIANYQTASERFKNGKMKVK